MGGLLAAFDKTVIAFLKRSYQPLARVSLAIVFGWFGFLKLLGLSPANPLVVALLNATLPSINATTFFVVLGTYEMLIGLLFLIPKAERAAIALLIPHFCMTVGALILVPEATWSGFLVPTLEGQYIIKNLVIVALACGIAAQLHPLKLDKRR